MTIGGKRIFFSKHKNVILLIPPNAQNIDWLKEQIEANYLVNRQNIDAVLANILDILEFPTKFWDILAI